MKLTFGQNQRMPADNNSPTSERDRSAEHPNVVPVRVGQLEDGRTFYTLRISNGLTLSAAIQHVHQASSQGT